MSNIQQQVQAISQPPSIKTEFERWVKGEIAIDFLMRNAAADEFVVYAGVQNTFMHSVFVPERVLDTSEIDEFLSFDANPFSGWGISIAFDEERSASIAPPLEHTGSKLIDQGEQIVFGRNFEGLTGDHNYFEVLQKLTQIFDLHFIKERNAYCKLDQHGDLEDMIRIIDLPEQRDDWGGTIITFNRDLLDQYAALTGSVIVRVFDFMQFRKNEFNGWSNSHEATIVQRDDLTYRMHVQNGHSGFLRGCQIVRSRKPKSDLLRILAYGDQEERQYASFLAWDWKNKVLREISTDPAATANYFTESDLPFELSPTFFRAEVLSKYKSNTEKYRLEERSIGCRGAWHLQSYDINEAGQVHSYIVYLRRLPYEEQLYWRAFNERPKGGISKGAMKTDFQGCWDLDYEPLGSLRTKLRDLSKHGVLWWTLRAPTLMDQVHYPATTSPDEWANEILQLDQLLVEGFEEKWLRKSADVLGRAAEKDARSLKLLEECLIGLDHDHNEADAKALIAPLRELHLLRSKVKGHAGGEEAAALRQKALSEHSSYRQQFWDLCARCDEALEKISASLQKVGAAE
jgi:hypothetical protein